MSKVFFKSLLISPALFGAALAVSSAATAADSKISELSAPATSEVSSEVQPSVSVPETLTVAQAVNDNVDTRSLDQINRYGREGRAANSMSQVTSVSQLSDVRPTDWAFQALQSLVERYGCIVGYPDKTYRGNRAMTRYEFAAGLNACMDRVNELIAAATADLVKKEDLAILQRLQEEFAAELATLRGRVDALEARTTTLEKQQFSTTTKLSGEVIFAVTDEFLVDGADNNTVFQDRVRLALNTSFTGKDLLVTRLAAGNANAFAIPGGTVTNLANRGTANFTGGEGLQTFNFGNTGGNAVYADWVAYFFPVGENLKFYIPAVSGLHYDYSPTFSGLMEAYDGGTGPLSVFAQRNPIYLIGGGSGAGVNFNAGKGFTVSFGYLADNSDPADGVETTFAANVPARKAGLFNGSYSALAQIGYDTGKWGLGLTYVNAYRRGAIFDTGSGLPGAGTYLANGFNSVLRTGAGGAVNPFDKFSSNVNAYGLSGYFKLGSKVSLNAFGAFVSADNVKDTFDSADIWTYGLGIAIADFGGKGNLLGFMGGVQPYVTNPDDYGIIADDDKPIHLEGFYKFQVTDNISITPGVIYLINPGQTDNNDNALIGTIRTTFTF